LLIKAFIGFVVIIVAEIAELFI